MKTALIQTKKPVKSNLSSAQKTFNRLKNQIENLQERLASNQILLNESLNYYHMTLEPAKKRAKIHLTECIKLFYSQYKAPSRLTKKELKALKGLIVNKIEVIFRSSLLKDFDSELCSIYKNLEGIDYKTAATAEFSDEMKEVEMMMKSAGLDIDLSNMSAEDDYHDMMKKFMDSMADAHTKMDENEAKPKAKENSKTKNQLKKEAKVQELKNLQKKGLSTIYKQLAKILHPDLEPNLMLKKEKEDLMKKLTVAYENNDLHTLLSLEIEWINYSEKGQSGGTLSSDEQLKIYNSILKDQISEIQNSIDMEYLHPKYLPIQEYIADNYFSPIESMLLEFKMVNAETEMYCLTLQDLQSNKAEIALKNILNDL